MRVPCITAGLILIESGENRKISGCPLGLPNPISFPPKKNKPLTNLTRNLVRKNVVLAETLEVSLCAVLLVI
jgi:hypothetical protein